ncbi:hypothetical protein IV203_031446 [Nitzschia inconspicua]|uniref:OTU domain-containing protein n=1 Tax=Nitzschia inconspicua TaxID=303405 RepID=A0A9K3LVC2_9STRA|nr:hypothetical protein IV203_031446 [Nitzschia inconspicua]
MGSFFDFDEYDDSIVFPSFTFRRNLYPAVGMIRPSFGESYVPFRWENYIEHVLSDSHQLFFDAWALPKQSRFNSRPGSTKKYQPSTTPRGISSTLPFLRNGLDENIQWQSENLDADSLALSDPQRKRKRYHVRTIPVHTESTNEDETCHQKLKTDTSTGNEDTKASLAMSTIPKWPFVLTRLRNTHVRESIQSFFRYLWDVPADGNCGYYVLFDFLQQHGLLPLHCESVTDLRRCIYDYALQHKQSLLAKDSYFIKLGYWKISHDHDGSLAQQIFHQDISRIYKDDVKYEGGCQQEFWMNANIVMPLVALRFGINVWLLSADGDPWYDQDTGRELLDKPYTTMYTLTKEGTVSREIVEGTVAFPLESPQDASLARTTAYVIHVEGNHYIGAKR